MSNLEENIIKCIVKISDAEKDYLSNKIDRKIFFDIILEAKVYYVKYINNSKFYESKNYKVFLLCLLQKVMANLMFEDKLCEVISNHVVFFETSLKLLTNEIIENCKKVGLKSIEEKTPKKSAINNSKSKRLTKRSNYPQRVLKIFKEWLSNNITNPYPTEVDKQEFCELTGLDITQINNWFINARRRLVPKTSKKSKNKR